MTGKQELGAVGEEIAARFLIDQGYCLVDQNTKTRNGELDIIMKHPTGHWVFVEVKTVSGYGPDHHGDLYDPIDKLSRHKIHKLHRAIVQYLGPRCAHERWQLDAVIVYINADTDIAQCRLYEHISRDW